jgi:chemotaxis protein CheX
MPKRSKSDSKLRLGAVLDLKAAAPLAELLLSRRGHDVELDGSDVERLGAQCLQVLLSARTSWAADGRNFAVEKLSPAIIATLELLGITPTALQYRRDITA